MSSYPLSVVPTKPPAPKETMGQRVRQVREERGLTLSQLEELILERFGRKVGASTIRELELGTYVNAGFKNIELIARALDIPPLELMALGLDEEPEERLSPETPAFYRSKHGRLWRAYNETRSRTLRTLVDEVLQMLLDRFAKD